MKQLMKGTILVGVVAAAMSGIWLLNTLMGQPAASALPAMTVTLPPVTPVFSATLSLNPSDIILQVGDMLTVTADLSISAGCQYPIFELLLRQTDGETPVFAHVEPPTHIITGPIQLPSAWTFRATQPGAATFSAQTFGERYCNDFWNWQYVYGASETIHVIGPYRLFSPFISKQ
jgi:hypothetical protein